MVWNRTENCKKIPNNIIKFISNPNLDKQKLYNSNPIQKSAGFKSQLMLIYRRDEQIYVFLIQIRSNNFIPKSSPNPKTESFKIKILFKSKI